MNPYGPQNSLGLPATTPTPLSTPLSTPMTAPMSPMGQLSFNSWWGRHTIEPNRLDLWQLGPLKLWVQQLANQWRFSYVREPDWLDATVRIVPHSAALPPPSATRFNCAFTSKAARQDLIFAPSLADRSMITKLDVPLEILPKETSQIYVVSPLRLRIELPDSGILIQEIPVHRPSDTWFGPANEDGELAYANDGTAYLDLGQVPLRLHCAVTSVTIRNSGATPLRLERVSIPYKRLSLFYSSRSGFWTDSIVLERKNDNEMALMQLAKQPPLEASPSQFVLAPRVQHDENLLFRAFSALLIDRHSK